MYTQNTLMHFKQFCAELFKDNLQDRSKFSYLNYGILFLIILSMVAIFLSTYDDIAAKYGFWLHLIDYITLGVFTIEVALRIWCADLLDPKYQGFFGRIKYCFSFYGLVDILSTYTFYLALFLPISNTTVQILRVFRLFRIFRYLKSVGVLSRAIQAKKDDMLVSIEFLGIITLILAFILYFVEHQAQPEVFNNGMTSVMWSFLQYIGDPGQFADTPPITTTGRIIASLIGILTIAIFAVPAGLIGSAFTEIMEEDKQDKELKDFEQRILHSFRFNYDRQNTKLYYVPRYQPLGTILTRKYLSEAEIIKTVGNSDHFHLFNLANAISPSEQPTDKIVVVNFKKNRPYGCCIDRGSKITIVSTSGFIEPITSWFAYHIAKIGGFNYVAKEIETSPDSPVSYYNITDENDCPNLKAFLDDIHQLANKPNSWVFPILGSVNPVSISSQLHFCFAKKNSPADIDPSQTTIQDSTLLTQMYQDFENVFKQNFNLNCDQNVYYGVVKDKTIEWRLKNKGISNICTLRIEMRLFVFDVKSIAYAKTIADILNQHLEPNIQKQIPEEMQKNIKNAYSMLSYNDGNDFRR